MPAAHPSTLAAPLDRRPIAARDRRVFVALARALARQRIHPNTISIAGLFCGLAAAVCLAATSTLAPFPARLLWLGAAILIPLRLLANMLDGMVALAGDRISPLGEVFNEVPDRIADAAILIGLGYAAGGSPELGAVAAMLAVLTAYIRAVGKSLGLPSDFRGPMAKPHRMFIIMLAAAYLAVSPESWRPVIVVGPEAAPWGLPAIVLVIIALGCVVTAARRLHGVCNSLKAGHCP